MEEPLSRILSELETIQNLQDPDHQTPISEPTLLDLQTLIDDGEDADRLWEEMTSKNLPPSFLVRSITATIDSGVVRLSLLASHTYLSILLAPATPVYTLFDPFAFLSVLRSIRRSLKHQQSGASPADADGSNGEKTGNRKRKGKGGRVRGRNSQNVNEEADNDDNGNRTDVGFLISVLERLESVVGRVHLNGFLDSMKYLVETVAGIPVMALEFYENSNSFRRLQNTCFRILCGVLRPEHGDLTGTAVEVLKSLSPSMLLPKSQVRASALGFVTGRIMVEANESDAIRKAIVYLPRYLANKAPEKSEPRSIAVDSILEIVKAMEFEDQTNFVGYVVKMTTGKTHLRIVAVDLILALLTTLKDPLGVNQESRTKEGGETWWGLRSLEALIQRCSDTTAGIRARALSNMAYVVEFLSGDVRNHACLQELLGFGNSRGRNLEGGLNELLKKRCTDEKAAVRKAALLLIMKSTALLGRAIDEIVLKTIGMACSDPLVSIRKAAISALSEVFRKVSDRKVIFEWLHSVPRLITDNESSIQEECENLFLELVLDRVSKVKFATSFQSSIGIKGSLEKELETIFPDGVLVLLKEICDGEVAPCIKKICMSLGKKKQLKAAIAIGLQNIIKSSESIWLSNSRPIEKWTAPAGAFLLLSEVSSFVPKAVDWSFLHHHWQLLDKNVSESDVRTPSVHEEMAEELSGIESSSISWAGDRVFLLQTISNVSLELPPEPAAELAHTLLSRIEEFNMHTTEVNAHVKALRTLCKRKAMSLEEGDILVSKWVNQLLSKALQVIDNYLLEVSEGSKASEFRTPPRSGSRKKGKRGPAKSEPSLQAITAVFTVGSLILVCPTAELKGIIPLLHTIITSGSSGPKPKQLSGFAVSIKEQAPSLYVQSWFTMGKICLADDNLAKRYIPLFVQELEKSDCAALRNNIVVVMADFCVRYTALVDCYISKITNSLRDPCEVVRRQTFILLSRLLQRDYVKWRGILFLRFLLSLVDESEKIRQLADFLFGNILKAKAPLLAYNSFVEAIFILNDCHNHGGHSGSHGSQTGHRLFSIRGNDEKSRSQRMHIYTSLLKQMAPEHLLATSAKLCAEILAASSDGLLNLDDVTAQSVLQDTLQILACKEMRIQSNRGTTAETTEMEEEGGESGGSLMAARGRVVTQVAKKNLIQNAVPIFIELKRLLESRNSPLTGCLMECLRTLLKDYKHEIDEILVADKQLQKELIYDMQKYEAAKVKSTVSEAVATLHKSDGYRSPPSQNVGVSKLRSVDNVHVRLAEQLGSAEKIASAVADVAAAATVRSVLKEMNKGASATPPLHSMSMPKLKSTMGGVSRGNRPLDILESVRRRQSFDSDIEN